MTPAAAPPTAPAAPAAPPSPRALIALPRRDLALAVRLAALLTAATFAVAVLVRLVAADAARSRLDLDFDGGLPHRLGEVAAIVGHNVALLGAVAGAIAIVGLRHAATADTGRWLPAAVLLCDVAVVASGVRHVIVLGAAFGGYGTKAIIFLAPHGVLELVAYSIALAIFVRAHREPVSGARCATALLIATATLAAAAFLEVYVS